MTTGADTVNLCKFAKLAQFCRLLDLENVDFIRYNNLTNNIQIL